MQTLPATPDSRPQLNYAKLDRDLDRTKVKLWTGKSALFYGSIISALKYKWTESVPTAATDGETVYWNPYYFHYLDMEGRKSILMHEVRHVAYLHMLRYGGRDKNLWNIACDIILDNEMDYEGYKVSGPEIFPPILFPYPSRSLVNHAYDHLSAEEIYDLLLKEEESKFKDYRPDLIDPGNSASKANAAINIVVSAVHTVKLGTRQAGDLPGNIESMLKTFLKPKLPWKQLFYRFFTELSETDYSWKRPNRRHADMYLPSLIPDEDGLAHIMYFEDVSGSVSDAEVIRFNSEVKYIWETFNPLKMTLVQFDTQITKETTYNRGDRFDEVVVVGRGGTCLVPVRKHILKHNPSAVVVFSDLDCDLMERLPANKQIPIIWVCINNPKAQVNEGQLIHIKE